MISQTINLTRLWVEKEVQYLFFSSQNYYENIIRDNKLRKRLINYILDKLPQKSLFIKELTEIPKDASNLFPPCPMEEQMKIHFLLQMGIIDILQDCMQQIEI